MRSMWARAFSPLFVGVEVAGGQRVAEGDVATGAFSPLFVGVEVAGSNHPNPARFVAYTFSPLFVGVEVAGESCGLGEVNRHHFQSPIRRGRGCWTVATGWGAKTDK